MAGLNQYTTILKPFARANALPLDRDEVWESLSAAEEYLSSPLAYAGQTIKVKIEDGKYKSFILQPSDTGEGNSLVLEEITSSNGLKSSNILFVDELPEESPKTEVVYVVTTDNSGYIWDGTDFIKIFSNISQIAQLDGAVFTGAVILATDPTEDMQAVTKNYVDTAMTWGKF